MRSLLLAFLLLLVPVAVTCAEDDQARPLLRLLEQIPAEAGGTISLSDVSASRRQIAPFVDTVAEPTRSLMPYWSLYADLNGFDMTSFGGFVDDGARAALGFSVFEIEQIAGWGTLPDAAVILRGADAHKGSIETALLSRKFEAIESGGRTIWGRSLEAGIDDARQDPFSVRAGSPQYFAFNGKYLLFSRSRPEMESLFNADRSLADVPEAGAIVTAGYLYDDAGELIDAVLVAGQPEARPGDLKPLPPFSRFGLLLLQDGTKMTGAIVIPYASVADAEIASARLTARLVAMKAPSVGRPFSEILPWPRREEIIEISHLAVLIFGFDYTVDVTGRVGLLTFMRNPRRRLMEMLALRDLAALIGRPR